MNRLTLVAAADNLQTALDFVEAELEASGLSGKARRQVCLAFDEVFSNIARYAYAPEAGEVTIRVSAGGGVTIEFEDGGAAYDPTAAPAPDLSRSLDESANGGLGVFLVSKLMDSATYRREGNKNILTIKKSGEGVAQ